MKKLETAVEKFSNVPEQHGQNAVGNCTPVPFTQQDFDAMMQKSAPLASVQTQLNDVQKVWQSLMNR
eukprot:3139463-Karenia_brevis.AAC.2